MTLKQSAHIEAPVEKVFDFFKDPANWQELTSGDITFKDVVLTREGVGTHYTWVARMGRLHLEGFNVFTEFVPTRRITDRSSRAFEGTWTYTFEPEGTGTRLTLENHSRSIWGLPPLSWLVDRSAARTHEQTMAALRARMEA